MCACATLAPKSLLMTVGTVLRRGTSALSKRYVRLVFFEVVFGLKMFIIFVAFCSLVRGLKSPNKRDNLNYIDQLLLSFSLPFQLTML